MWVSSLALKAGKARFLKSMLPTHRCGKVSTLDLCFPAAFLYIWSQGSIQDFCKLGDDSAGTVGSLGLGFPLLSQRSHWDVVRRGTGESGNGHHLHLRGLMSSHSEWVEVRALETHTTLSVAVWN